MGHRHAGGVISQHLGAKWAMECLGEKGENAEPRTWTQRRGHHYSFIQETLQVVELTTPFQKGFSAAQPPTIQDFFPKSSLCPSGSQTPALPKR